MNIRKNVVPSQLKFPPLAEWKLKPIIMLHNLRRTVTQYDFYRRPHIHSASGDDGARRIFNRITLCIGLIFDSGFGNVSSLQAPPCHTLALMKKPSLWLPICTVITRISDTFRRMIIHIIFIYIDNVLNPFFRKQHHHHCQTLLIVNYVIY